MAKKLAALALAFVIMLGCVAQADAAAYLGLWELEVIEADVATSGQYVEIQLNQDGSALLLSSEGNASATWSASGNRATIVEEAGAVNEFTLINGALVYEGVGFQEGVVLYFEKSASGVGASAFVGVWTATRMEMKKEMFGNMSLQISAGGAGELISDYGSDPLTWYETADGIAISDFNGMPTDLYMRNGRLIMDVNGVKLAFIRTGSAPQVPGDVQNDGKIDLSDAIAILDYCSGGSSGINTANADVNGDDCVDVRDALLILQYLAGWNVTLQ